MSETNKPSAEQLAKFKQRANDMSLSEDVRSKFRAIVEKFESAVEGEPAKEPRKPRATKEKAPSKTPAKRGRKPASTSEAKADSYEKAKADLKKKTGKTEEECETIIDQYRELRAKAQTRKAKEEEASKENKKRVEKLERKGDIIEGTNEKTADAVIETATEDVSDKIEKQIEAVEAKAEKEAKAEVAKDETLKTPKAKKEAVEAKVEKKVAEKTKTIVKRVVIDTSALLTSIATTLGKFDKDSQKEFLIKLRSDIDKLLAKYAFGGMTDGATQVMNIQQSNLSASSVNPTLFANGGIVQEDAYSINTIALLNGVRKSENTFQEFKRKLTAIIKRNGYRMPTEKAFEIAYQTNQFAKGGGVEKSSGLNYGKKDDVYFDVVTLLNNKMQKPKSIFGQEKVQVKTMSLDSLMEYVEKYKNDIRYEVDLPIELFTKESFHKYSDEGIKFKFVNGKIYRLGKEELLKKKIDLYTKERRFTPPQKVLDKFEKEVQDAPAKTTIVQRIHSQQLLAKGGRMYAEGGMIGQEIVFDDNGEENTGVIKDITNLGDYVVKSDDGRTLLAQRDLDVISFGAMRQQGVEQRKKRFGFFGKGGSIGSSAKLQYINDAFASYELQDELREKLGIDENAYSVGDNVVISFAYTDYGGDFLDKVAIEYFKENYPDNTLSENTSYSGENAFVFGEPAQEWIDSTEDYPLGFEDFEDFYYEKMNEAEYESFEYFLDDLERDDYTFDKEEVMSWLMENKGGYYSMTTQGLDFSYSDLTDELLDEGLISKEDEDDEEYARGGEIGQELMGGQSNSTKKPSGAILLKVIGNGREIIVTEDGGKTKERYVRRKGGVSGYALYYNGEQYEFTDSFAKGGMTEHGLRIGDEIMGESKDLNAVFVKNKDEWHNVFLDKGSRYAKGGNVSSMLRNRRGQ